jgi:hypothetical protein
MRANTRRRRAVESFRSAAETIGPIEKDMALFALTRGQFSMIDAVHHVLAEIGPAAVSIWTWTIADYEIEVMTSLLVRSEITGAVLVIDRSAEDRNAKLIDQWRQRFGDASVKVCKNHAKVATLKNERFRLLLRGSMNLNFNPRFEQLDVTEGGEDFDLVERVEGELPVLPRRCSNADAESASGVNKAFELGQLEMFRGVKRWAK